MFRGCPALPRQLASSESANAASVSSLLADHPGAQWRSSGRHYPLAMGRASKTEKIIERSQIRWSAPEECKGIRTCRSQKLVTHSLKSSMKLFSTSQTCSQLLAAGCMGLQPRRSTDLDVFLHSAIRLYDDGEKKVKHAPTSIDPEHPVCPCVPCPGKPIRHRLQCTHLDILAAANAVLLSTWNTSIRCSEVADSDRCCRSVAHQLEIANQMR